MCRDCEESRFPSTSSKASTSTTNTVPGKFYGKKSNKSDHIRNVNASLQKPVRRLSLCNDVVGADCLKCDICDSVYHGRCTVINPVRLSSHVCLAGCLLAGLCKNWKKMRTV